MALRAPAGRLLKVYPVPAPVMVCPRLTSPPRAPFAKQGPGTHKKPAWIRVFSVCSSPTTTRGFFYTSPQPHNAAHTAERALPGRVGAQPGLPARGSFPLVPAYLRHPGCLQLRPGLPLSNPNPAVPVWAAQPQQPHACALAHKTAQNARSCTRIPALCCITVVAQ